MGPVGEPRGGQRPPDGAYASRATDVVGHVAQAGHSRELRSTKLKTKRPPVAAFDIALPPVEVDPSYQQKPPASMLPGPRFGCCKVAENRTSDFCPAGTSARTGENLPATKAWHWGRKNRKSVPRDNAATPVPTRIGGVGTTATASSCAPLSRSKEIWYNARRCTTG